MSEYRTDEMIECRIGDKGFKSYYYIYKGGICICEAFCKQDAEIIVNALKAFKKKPEPESPALNKKWFDTWGLMYAKSTSSTNIEMYNAFKLQLIADGFVVKGENK